MVPGDSSPEDRPLRVPVARSRRRPPGVLAIADLLEAGSNQFELLEFLIEEVREGRVSSALYGINVYKVLRVIPTPSIFQIPGQGEYVSGVFDFDGVTLPLLNLRKFLGLGEEPSGADQLVVVSEFNNVRVGIQVNAATRIHRLAWQEVRIPTDVERRTIYRGIVGLVVLGEQLIRILNVEEILAEAGMGSAAYIGEADLSGLESRLQDLAEEPGSSREGSGAPAAEGDSAAGETPPKGPIRMALVVDDSGMMRNLVAKVLEAEGYEVLKLPDGQAAWTKLQTLIHQARAQDRAVSEIVPLAVVDIEMPRMDGFTLTRNIKADTETSPIKVLIHSSLGGPENQAKAQAVGADGFAVKFDARRLQQAMRGLVP